MSDYKIVASAGKPPLDLLPLGALIGAARVFGYGAKKYAAGNFLLGRTTDGAIHRYVGAALRHLAALQGADGLYTPLTIGREDDESGLPEFDHLLCSLIMLRAVLADEGYLPKDPGPGKDPVRP